MQKFPFLFLLVILAFLVPAGIAADNTTGTFTTAPVTTDATSVPDRTGGSIFFETEPVGATVWLDNVEIGTSPLVVYSEKTGPQDVLVRRKGFKDFSGTVTMKTGQRVDFFAQLTPVTYDLTPGDTTVAPLSTATTVRKSSITVPTPWPTTPSSPVDLAVVFGAASLAAVFVVMRRR